jgi:hypothetical protein
MATSDLPEAAKHYTIVYLLPWCWLMLVRMHLVSWRASGHTRTSHCSSSSATSPALQIAVYSQVSNPSQQVQSTSPVSKSSQQVQSASPVSKSGQQVRSATPVSKSGQHVQSASPVSDSGSLGQVPAVTIIETLKKT